MAEHKAKAIFVATDATDEEIATLDTTIEQVVAATMKRKRENGVLYIVERIKDCFEAKVPLFQVIHDLGGDVSLPTCVMYHKCVFRRLLVLGVILQA